MEWTTRKYYKDDEYFINRYYKFKSTGGRLIRADHIAITKYKFKIKGYCRIYKLLKIDGLYLTFEY